MEYRLNAFEKVSIVIGTSQTGTHDLMTVIGAGRSWVGVFLTRQLDHGAVTHEEKIGDRLAAHVRRHDDVLLTHRVGGSDRLRRRQRDLFRRLDEIVWRGGE